MVNEAAALDVTDDRDVAQPYVKNPERLSTNPELRASCLVRYDLNRNCIHIHN